VMEAAESKNFGIDIGIIVICTIVLSFIRYNLQKYLEANYIGKVPDIQKFSECTWKSFIYGFLWVYSLYCVAMQDFFYDTRLCFENFPNTPMKLSFKVWYFLQLGYYWSCFFFQRMGKDVKRKDEKQMIVHHVVTISLITGSYIYGYALIGGVILCLNDFNDFVYNFGKVFEYRGYKWVLYALFPVFGISWFTNRIYYGWTKILSVSFFILDVIPIPMTHYYLFNAGLVIMLILNIWWFTMICNLVYRMIFQYKSYNIVEIREEGYNEKKGETKGDEKKGKNGEEKKKLKR